MTPRTITITVADYQRLEQKWLVDLATARRESVVFERRIGELEAMLDEFEAKLEEFRAELVEKEAKYAADLQKANTHREGIET